MITKENLVATYHAWEQQTQREGRAIQEGNWRLVGECQLTKLELQKRIIRLTEPAKAEDAAAGLDPKEFNLEVCRIVSGLVALETRNAELLSDCRQQATSQMAELDHACRNLKRVQRFYGQPSRAAWHSYS
jgi:hypothetical protein